jgi:hypothetical protein
MACLQNSIIGNQRVGRGDYQNNSSLSLGYCSLINTTSTNSGNVTMGVNSLRGVTTGDYNVAIGYKALCSVTTGNNNTAAGYLAGCTTTTGTNNTFLGYKTYNPSSAATCTRNTAIGFCAQRTAIGSGNTAIGTYAQTDGTSACSAGSNNVAIGFRGGYISCGDGNVAIGTCTKAYGNSVLVGKNRYGCACSTAVGTGYYSTGLYSISLGYCSRAWGNNTIAIGCGAINGNSDHIQWGNSSNNVKNCIWPTWGALSDQRDKTNIQSLDPKYGIEFIKKLKPKSFNWDNRETYVRECGFEFGQKDGTLANSEENYGFMAQEIDKTIEELDIKFDALRGKEKDAFRLTYPAFIAPMIKTVQEIATRLELLDQEITQLETV